MVAKRADRDAAEQILQMHLLRPDIMSHIIYDDPSYRKRVEHQTFSIKWSMIKH